MRFNYSFIFPFLILSIVMFGCISTGSNTENNQTNMGTNTSLQEVGCLYNNPSCDISHQCVNNSCIPKTGCDFNNPACDQNRSCVNNSCILKSGCLYANPSCDQSHECINNTCISMSPVCAPPSDLTITTESISGASYDVYTRSGSKIRVVCQQPCPIPENVLETRYDTIERLALYNLTKITGGTLVDQITPIDIHYTGDTVCGHTDNEGDFFLSNGKGTICTYLYDRSLANPLCIPFDMNYSCTSPAMLLETHELGHALFSDTNVSYWIQENFVKALSFEVSGSDQCVGSGNDVLKRDINSSCDETTNTYAPLNYELCKLYGIDFASYMQIFTAMDARRDSGQGMGDQDFKNILDNIAGQNTFQAFIDANQTLGNKYGPASIVK